MSTQATFTQPGNKFPVAIECSMVAIIRQSVKTGDWRLAWLLLPITLVTYGLLGNTKTVFIRYMMPMLPMLVMFSVIGLEWLTAFTSPSMGEGLGRG